VRVLVSFELEGRSQASRAEYWVKRLSATEKWSLISGERTLESVIPAG
jgi:putative endonuclease